MFVRPLEGTGSVVPMIGRMCVLVFAVLYWLGCSGGETPRGTAQIDTLSSGHVVVTNGRDGAWLEDEGWSVAEEFRIGALHSGGPEGFARISSLTVDDLGRTWVLESQAAELRVFDASGTFVRTIGQQGAGPGEFSQPARVDFSAEGDVWVMDPGNARLTVFDTLGVLKRTIPFGGGFFTIPWRGGFDRSGRYFSPVLDLDSEIRIGLGVFNSELTALDTISPPTDPGERGSWRIVSEGQTRVMAGIPFQGRLVWKLSKDGTLWALLTDQYRLMEFSLSGDTLRSITKNVDVIPVSEREREEALENLTWFTNQGGRINPSEIPTHKPAVNWFFLDERDHIWVARTEEGNAFHVFDPDGRFLGVVELSFELQEVPEPIVRDGLIYGVVRDEYDVPYVVRARIDRQ